jgi:hypothetical protein
MVWQLADGSDTAEALMTSPSSYLTPGACSPDGRFLAFQESDIKADLICAYFHWRENANHFSGSNKFNEWGPAFHATANGSHTYQTNPVSTKFTCVRSPARGKLQISNGGENWPGHQTVALVYRND